MFYKIYLIVARLKWQPPQNQNYPNYQGKNFNSFEPPPPRMKVWQNQHQNIPNNRFAPSQYFSTPDSVQHYTQPQMVSKYLNSVKKIMSCFGIFAPSNKLFLNWNTCFRKFRE